MFSENSLSDFNVKLSSKDAVPGGGGAASLCGAVGASLAVMVGNLTIGKKKYAAVEEEVIEIMKKSTSLRDEFLSLIDEDAKAFEPLSKAYSLPSQTDEEKTLKASIMEKALVEASLVPLKIMEKCCEAIALHAELATKGSTLAISDVGVGACCCKAALMSASLNVFINTSLMKDIGKATELNKKADEMLNAYCKMADNAFADVLSKIKG